MFKKVQKEPLSWVLKSSSGYRMWTRIPTSQQAISTMSGFLFVLEQLQME